MVIARNRASIEKRFLLFYQRSALGVVVETVSIRAIEGRSQAIDESKIKGE